MRKPKISWSPPLNQLQCKSRLTHLLTAQFNINNRNIRCLLDTGSDIDIINQKYVYKTQVIPSNRKLIMWNDSVVKPIGEATLQVFNPKTKQFNDVKFVVVKNSFNCLLGAHTIFKLNLMSANTNNFVAKVGSKLKLPIDKKKNIIKAADIANTSEFGDLGFLDFDLKSDAKPVALPARKVPIALERRFENKLKELQTKSILKPVNGASEWGSGLTMFCCGKARYR